MPTSSDRSGIQTLDADSSPLAVAWYEATQYKGVSVERLQAVADALKLRVREVITFEPL